MTVIVDSSTALAWVMVDEQDPPDDWRRRLLDERGLAPAVWPLETANAIVSAERRGRLTAEDRDNALRLLARLPIDIDVAEPRMIWTRGVELSRLTGLTIYDATFVELAMRTGGVLMTLDRAMAEAARRLGISVMTA